MSQIPGVKNFKQLDKGVNEDVDMHMSSMKPLTAQWMTVIWRQVLILLLMFFVLLGS